MKINKHMKEDYILSMTLMTPFVILTFQYLVLIIFNLLDTSIGSIIQLFSKFIVAIVFLFSFPIMWKRVSKLFILFYGFSIFIFSLHYLFFIPNRPYLLDLTFSVFFMSLPAIIYILAVKNLKVFETVVKIAAKIVFVFGVVIGIFIFTGNASVGVYSMTLSYYILLPALLFLGNFIDKFRFTSFFLFLTALLIILSLGSRGALLCIGFFGLLKIIRTDWKSSRKDIFVRICFVISIFVLFFQKNEILIWLELQFVKYGISSRTITLLQQDEIHLSGRDNIVFTILEKLKDNPFLGVGIAGDRVLTGTYSHNIFIEILSGFGIIVGMIIITFLLVMLVKSLIINEKYLYDSAILWISLGFVSLMVSSSYLISIKFWILLGLLISISFKKRMSETTDYE